MVEQSGLAERASELSKVGDAQLEQGNYSNALTAYRNSLAIMERLAKSDRGNRQRQFNVFLSYFRLALAHQEASQLSNALAAAWAAADIILRLHTEYSSLYKEDINKNEELIALLQVLRSRKQRPFMRIFNNLIDWFKLRLLLLKVAISSQWLRS